MDKNLLIYFFYSAILLAGTSCSSLGTTENKEDAKKKIVTDGIVKKVGEDGKIYAELTLKNGRKNGVCKNFFKNGHVQMEINYVNDVKEGVAKAYYKNGNLYRETFYIAGKKNDFQKVYRPDGQLMAEVPYKNDVPGIGLKEYLLNGQPKTKFPEIVIKTENNLLKNNTYLVFVSLSQRYKNQEFYVGELDEGKYLTGDKFVRLIPKRGVVKLTYTVPPGHFIMEQLNFICKSTTVLGNPFVTQRRYNLSIEHIPL